MALIVRLGHGDAWMVFGSFFARHYADRVVLCMSKAHGFTDSRITRSIAMGHRLNVVS
jgi:hypothetical protein